MKRKNSTKARMVNLGLAGALMCGMFYTVHQIKDYERNSIVDNPKKIFTRNITSRDTYWSIAKEIRDNCNLLRNTDTRELVDKLREMNPSYSPGNLQIGNEIKVPVYSCGD